MHARGAADQRQFEGNRRRLEMEALRGKLAQVERRNKEVRSTMSPRPLPVPRVQERLHACTQMFPASSLWMGDLQGTVRNVLCHCPESRPLNGRQWGDPCPVHFPVSPSVAAGPSEGLVDVVGTTEVDARVFRSGLLCLCRGMTLSASAPKHLVPQGGVFRKIGLSGATTPLTKTLLGA